MRRYQYLAIVGAFLVVAGMMLMLQSPVSAQGENEGDFLAGYHAAWAASPHADAQAEAFVHWDGDGAVPETCARCHSTPGYRDFLGVDGSEPGVVDHPAPLGTTVNCDSCHNAVASNLTTVPMPSGVLINDSTGSARCMVCHQGRASMVQVEAAIQSNNLADDPNTPSADLRFINIHYYAAAATLYGTEALGGYQYEGMRYQMKNDHVPGYNACADCHNPHTTEVRVDECATCHIEVRDASDLRFIRTPGTYVDYDGDGDDFEGIADEIETLQDTLYDVMRAYAMDVVGTPIAYDEHAYPYFFIDGNNNGFVDEEEANGDNGYNAFTANLLRAAYNYQVTLKDPGGYAHNPTYHIQLLHDSITALNSQIPVPVDVATVRRNQPPFVELIADGSRTDPAHFDTTAEAFRHWDEDGEVPGTCTRCHTAGGLPQFLHNGVTIAAPPSDSLSCTTCHDSMPEFSTYVVDAVTFPSGATVSFGERDEANLCLNCHQGRESTISINAAIVRAAVGDDEPSEALRFRNPHYFAAGATLFGTEAMGAYQYENQSYSGRFLHDGEDMTTCTDCHDRHSLQLEIQDCRDCHRGVRSMEDLRLIRLEGDGEEPVDYNGNGDVREPIAAEIATFQQDLFERIKAYAIENNGAGILYDAHAYPYWFADLNENGELDPEEANGGNAYVAWTPELLRAAYNYMWFQKDPGAFAHNPDYSLQVLYDSIEAIAGPEAVANYVRPEVEAVEGG